MANELNFYSTTPGATLTARLIRAGAVVASGIALAEGPAGFYRGTVPTNTPRGVYVACAVDALGQVLSIGELAWAGDRELDPLSLDDLHLIHGLRMGANLVVSKTSRTAGAIQQSLSEVSEVVTVQRTA
ncbi:MAG TPA: hypothetical protein VFV57_05910 [Limnobacter sp.]|nr:hypothetical protein [Limnobacter sp.]